MGLFPSPSRFLEHSGTVFGAIVLLIAGLYHGSRVETVSVDLFVLTVRLVFLEAYTAVAIFTIFVSLTGFLLVREVWRSPETRDHVLDGPTLTAVVPVYRDHDVLETSVRSLLESRYENLEIAIVAEPNDHETVAAARELAAEHDRVECLINGRPGSKAGAINHAVRALDAEYVAVFDADEWIAPEFLPIAMGSLLDGNDVFQGRRVPRATGVVETIAYCERIVFHASYKLVELFDFTNCRSSSTVVTREAFERVGGYDDMLTEDLDFAHKCYRAGLQVEQARQCTNTMEAPHTLADLWGQRKRWRVGQIEVLHATLREAIGGEIDRRGLVSIGRMCSSLFGSLVTLVLTSKILLLVVLGVESAFLLPFACLVGTIVLAAVVDVHRGRIDRVRWPVVLAPLLYPAFGILTLKSLLEYALSWDGEWYRVTKTESV